MTSFLLAWACLSSADLLVRESAAQATTKRHLAQPVARHQAPAKPAALLPAHSQPGSQRGTF
ncbi:hypothetical protein [Hymenobacter terricola]|uniref:hypothetical protein n=1 Tax=Hymenobacter terricola TaxID=2819236 RepID=UPI001B314CA0|nr:hypothetical protein [Hymenobacter terricola]